MKSIVMKFGGASVGDLNKFSHIADIVAERKKQIPNVVIVVSAMQGVTDQLLDIAHVVHPTPPQRELDMLVSVGERISISLLAMALERKGLQAVSFTGSQSGIITSNDHGTAKIVDVRPHRISESLEEGKVVIVAGFQGVSLNKEITTLGRGGSDTSAVALALGLKAEKVEFYKDVAGIYDKDPKKADDAKMFSELSYQEAMDLCEKGAKVLNPRCIHLAKENLLPLEVRSFELFGTDQDTQTVVHHSGSGRRIDVVYEKEATPSELKV